MTSSLDLLKASGTTVVCDSGDFATIEKYRPQDATTNPSLILAASKKEEYSRLIDVAVQYGKEHGGPDIDSKVDAALDRLLVEFGKEILHKIPGKVSTEVDARFSFDTKASVEKALHIVEVCVIILSWRAPASTNICSSSTTLWVLGKRGSLSKSLRPGRASRQLIFYNRSTGSIVT